ncbi:peroxiredoxin-like family protein [Cyanobacterium aponinum UTEX 3222]|uniref:Uncharacterized protein n=1 Tax=Cyanobacterium aponinum 0216 TaxID=2676140 RepID=A0A844GTR4_9CHRO|nr:peroxiredoxin-like family protein [Cyanobacterium aponinum]MTF39874.1 hypothetical protein [Cyanobacterium aponinum 0216]WRL43089.1 peroxiredoxin-like family protein [Cyanobacterium aponinum UTEX 3222]
MNNLNTNTVEQSNIYSFLKTTQRVRVSDGKEISIFNGTSSANYILLLVLPQLGDFDSLEYAWWLNKYQDILNEKKIALRAIAIGNLKSGEKYCQYTGFNPENLFLDETAEIHQQLNLYQGLNWQFPTFNCGQNQWLNLILMCAGIGSKGTLKEVLRGYFGDKKAPSLLQENEIVNIKFLPPIKGSLFNKVGKNYQRPFELATIRLKNMIEVLTNWRTYVPNDNYLTQRGGTFLFNNQGKIIYQHRDEGILGFAENKSNPLAFLP